MTDRLAQLLTFHEADPTDTFCTYGIAMEHAKRGETAQAIDWLDRTLRLDANHAYAYYQKASLLNGLGRVDEAKHVVVEGQAAAKRAGDTHAAQELEVLMSSFGGGGSPA